VHTVQWRGDLAVRAMTLHPWGDDQRARGALEDDDRFLFTRPVRRFLVVYVGVAVLACLALAPSALDEREYLDAFFVVSTACWLPGVFIAWRAARRAPHGDRLVWRLWVAGFALGWVVTVQVLLMDDAGFAAVQRRSIGAALLGVALLVFANTLVLRSRSGQRAVLIDVADIVMALAAITAPLVLLFGAAIVTAEARWFTVSAAVWFLGALYGTAVAIVLYLRVRPEDRVVARFGVAFGLITMLSSAGQALIGVGDFERPPGPFLAVHALCAGFTVVFLAHSTRRASAGLERLPARAQVRRRPAITLLVLVSIPITGALVVMRRDDDWALLVALATAAVLVSLFCVRSLLAARETRLLYREVERSADERAELLTDVLAHADADRHRVATHLHRQSVQLYTALSTVVEPLGADDRGRAVAARVAEHLRADLGRQSDDLRRFALAVRPPCDEPGAGVPAASSFSPLLRAQLDGLYPEGRGPRLDAAVDPELVLDWTDEAVLLRVAEQAFRVLSTRAPTARRAEVELAAAAGALVLDLRLDGCGDAADSPPLAVDADELGAVRAGAELLGGTLELTGDGTTVGIRVRVPFGRPEPGHGPGSGATGPDGRPALRVVDGA
jgi:hypothetical protein